MNAFSLIAIGARGLLCSISLALAVWCLVLLYSVSCTDEKYDGNAFSLFAMGACGIALRYCSGL